MLCGRPGILLDRASQRSLLGEINNVWRSAEIQAVGKGERSANFKIIFVPVGNKVLCTFTLCLSLFTRALRECESVCASDCWHAQQYLLEDSCGKSVAGGFYEYELHRVANPDVYLVEKVAKGGMKFM